MKCIIYKNQLKKESSGVEFESKCDLQYLNVTKKYSV